MTRSEYAYESARATYKEMSEAMSEALARQDAAQFADCRADDATVIGPGPYQRGRDDTSRSMALRPTGSTW